MKLPTFNALRSNYKGEAFEPADIYKLIGGKVEQNFNNNKDAYFNTCALRLSYAFNYSGVVIPFHKDETGSGSDSRWYFYRVKDIIRFINNNFPFSRKLTSKNKTDFFNHCGIIYFKANWRDSSGHITLWDGNKVMHGDYFLQSQETTL